MEAREVIGVDAPIGVRWNVTASLKSHDLNAPNLAGTQQISDGSQRVSSPVSACTDVGFKLQASRRVESIDRPAQPKHVPIRHWSAIQGELPSHRARLNISPMSRQMLTGHKFRPALKHGPNTRSIDTRCNAPEVVHNRHMANLNRVIGIDAEWFRMIAEWAIVTVLAPVLIYWLLRHHLTVHGDVEQLLAMGLAGAGIAVMVIRRM